MRDAASRQTTSTRRDAIALSLFFLTHHESRGRNSADVQENTWLGCVTRAMARATHAVMRAHAQVFPVARRRSMEAKMDKNGGVRSPYCMSRRRGRGEARVVVGIFTSKRATQTTQPKSHHGLWTFILSSHQSRPKESSFRFSHLSQRMALRPASPRLASPRLASRSVPRHE